MSDGWTAAIAIAGIAGTLGAAFGVPMLEDHRRRRREKRVAFRLVGGELAEIGIAVRAILRAGQMPDGAGEFFLRRSAWEAHKTTVALEVKNQRDWETLSIIYWWVAPFREFTLQRLGTPLEGDELRKMLADMARESFRMAKHFGVTKAMLRGADDDPLLKGGANGGAKPS